MNTRVLILFTLLSLSLGTFGQKTRKAYCEITVWSFDIMRHSAVTFDFGMQTYSTAMLYDSKDQPLRFITGMDVINYMSKRGWSLVSTYYKTLSKNESAHYIMEKAITNEKQVTDGLNMKQVNIDDFYRMYAIPKPSKQ